MADRDVLRPDPELRRQLRGVSAATVGAGLIQATRATAEALRQRDARIRELEARIERLDAALAEARKDAHPALVWRGVWRASEAYRRGECVTDSGALWHCELDGTPDRPGKGPGWRLMTKTR